MFNLVIDEVVRLASKEATQEAIEKLCANCKYKKQAQVQRVKTSQIEDDDIFTSEIDEDDIIDAPDGKLLPKDVTVIGKDGLLKIKREAQLAIFGREMENFELDLILRDLINTPASELSEEHKAPLTGGLRCFAIIPQRDSNNEMLMNQPYRRCAMPAIKGRLMCRKHGGNSKYAHYVVKHGRYSTYFNSTVGEVAKAFLNDTDMLDLKSELAILRTLLVQYISRVTMDGPEDYSMDKEIKKITTLIDQISRLVTRIQSIEEKQKYSLGIEAATLFLKKVIEVISTRIEDHSTKLLISKDLAQIPFRIQTEE